MTLIGDRTIWRIAKRSRNMSIHPINDDVLIGVSIPLKIFPALIEEHSSRYPRTRDVEYLGQQLRYGLFLESNLPEFIRAVCKWGGHPGIGGRILKNNDIKHIRDALGQANDFLSSSPANLQRALVALHQMHSLGEPSFASKHLRFLRPDICPVFDSVLRNALPYSFDADGYASFAADCTTISQLLRLRNIGNPVDRPDGVWYVADVEAALFVHFNGWL